MTTSALRHRESKKKSRLYESCESRLMTAYVIVHSYDTDNLKVNCKRIMHRLVLRIEEMSLIYIACTYMWIRSWIKLVQSSKLLPHYLKQLPEAFPLKLAYPLYLKRALYFPWGIDDKDTVLIKQVVRGCKNGIPNSRQNSPIIVLSLEVGSTNGGDKNTYVQ